MQFELEYPPEGFAGRDISGILKVVDLIDILWPASGTMTRHCRMKSDPGSVMALVNVLVEVLDSCEGGAHLDVDVRIVLGRQVGVVRNDPAVICSEIVFPEGPTIGPPLVLRIALIVQDRLFHQRARIVLGAVEDFSSIDDLGCHTGSRRVLCTAGTVDHRRCNCVV